MPSKCCNSLFGRECSCLQVKRSPVTEYFFWPRKDAWEELKDSLEGKPWIQERYIVAVDSTLFQKTISKKILPEAIVCALHAPVAVVFALYALRGCFFFITGPILTLLLLGFRDKIILLNKTTEIINFWQDSEKKKTIAEAKEAFPDCMFQGSD